MGVNLILKENTVSKMSPPFLWVHGGMNLVGSITLSRILPGSPSLSSPWRQESISSLLGTPSWLAALFAESSQWEGGNLLILPSNPPPRSFSLKAQLSHVQLISREGWAGFISAKWNPVFLPEALIYGAMLGRAVCGLSFSFFFNAPPWYSLNGSWQLAAK